MVDLVFHYTFLFLRIVNYDQHFFSSDRTWPVLTLGIITFLPGFYHLRIAYYAWRGYTGYSFDDIPDYND